MTINEEQELGILKIFIANNIGKFSSMTFPTALESSLGSGASRIVQNMIRDGFVADLHTQEYEFTITGRNRYKLLKSQKRKERVNKIAFWVIFGCTLVAAGDVIGKHVFPESIPKTATKSMIPPFPIKEVSVPKVLSDTISPPKDSLNQKVKN